MDINNIANIPPWWLVSRSQLADMLGVSPSYLANAAQRRQGPPPIPRDWVVRPQDKAFYRLSDVFSADAEQDAWNWLSAFAAPHLDPLPDDLPAALHVADGAIGKAQLPAVDRRERRRQPRLLNVRRFDLTGNPNIALFEEMPALEGVL